MPVRKRRQRVLNFALLLAVSSDIMTVKGLTVLHSHNNKPLRWRLRGCEQQAVTGNHQQLPCRVSDSPKLNMQPAEANSSSLVLEFVIAIIIITLIYSYIRVKNYELAALYIINIKIHLTLVLSTTIGNQKPATTPLSCSRLYKTISN